MIRFWNSLFGYENTSDVRASFQVVGMRSNLWPGAIAVMAGGAFSNVYIGYGLKNERLVPPPPPAVNDEWQAPLDEEGEPTFVLQESTELPPPPAEEVRILLLLPLLCFRICFI